MQYPIYTGLLKPSNDSDPKHCLKLAEITADVSDRLVSSIFVILEDHKILCHIVAQVTGMHVVHAVDVRVTNFVGFDFKKTTLFFCIYLEFLGPSS